MNIKVCNSNTPSWRQLTVQSQIPEVLEPLKEMSHNLWWTWNTDAYDLFRSIDPKLFTECKHNVVEMLSKISYDDFCEKAGDKVLLARMQKVYEEYKAYLNTPVDSSRASVAYFCMEYGIFHYLKIYSGGLGILAGDYLKEASDSNVPMTAIGLLYRYGYFTQEISVDGSQIATYEAQNFEQLGIDKVMDGAQQMVIDVPFPGYTLHALVWRANVGRVSLYLLDTDNEMNSEYDRSITHTLYGGNWENRIKQEVLLGIGGTLLLNKLGIRPDVYHCNEGHAAFCNVQRLIDQLSTGLTFEQALELVRASSLYTVHTPVPAGHDYFDESLLHKYLGSYAQRMQISWDDFIGLGRTNPDDRGERFCMSTFLCKTCQEVNGVSKLHGLVSKKMFAGIWKGYYPEENHVGYVTNGVHLPSWAASEWKEFYEKHFGKDFYRDQSNPKVWERIYDVPDSEIWQLRMALKTKLIDYMRNHFRKTWLKNQGDPIRMVSLLEGINPNALLIGFGRRFATYKRAHLLFTDIERLKKIVNNPERPVQFIYTGKAHPADGGGQGLIKRIYEISQMPEFLGKIFFLENYDMYLSRRLVSGVDIWLNTPTRGQEASGTSGEKALMNGLLNLSVLDGWWLEGYREGAGWALSEKRTYQSQEQQDQLDAQTIFNLLEHEIIPLYYARNKQGFSPGWIRAIKNSIATIAPHFTMKRQLDDYYERFYMPLAKRSRLLLADGAQKAKQIAQWKQSVVNVWDGIHVVSCDWSNESKTITSGSEFTITLQVDQQGLSDDIGVEMVITQTEANGNEKILQVLPFNVIKREGNVYTFQLTASIDDAGTFHTAFRLYPKNDLLPHREDFCYVKWF